MLDQESLRPVIIAMSIYLTICVLIPRIITKPTGIQIIDDLVMTMIAQRDSLMRGTLLTGIVVLASNYIQDEFF